MQMSLFIGASVSSNGCQGHPTPISETVILRNDILS